MLQLKDAPGFSGDNLVMTHPQHQQIGQHGNADGFLTAVRVPTDLVLAQPQTRLQLPIHELSGKGLARCLDRDSARFQPLPIGTAREVFPQAARPVDFVRRVMGRCDADGDFHWYAPTPASGLSFQSQKSPRTP